MRTSHDLEPDFSRPGISPRDSVPSPDHTCDNVSSSKANFKAHISLCLKWRWFPSVSVARRQAVSCSLVSAVPGPACSSLQHCSTRPPNCSCVQRCRGGGGGSQSSSVSQSSTDKNVPFYHHHRVPAVQPCLQPSPGASQLRSSGT